MPATEVFFYQDDSGESPARDWFNNLRSRDRRAYKKCFSLIRLLRQFGRELRRPRADYLRDGVYELRTEVGRVNYRILYGFVGQDVALLASALTKEKAIPAQEIDRAVERIAKYKRDPSRHRLLIEDPSRGEDE